MSLLVKRSDLTAGSNITIGKSIDASGKMTITISANDTTYDVATTSSTGIVQLATNTEVITGTNASKVVTPASLKNLVTTKITKNKGDVWNYSDNTPLMIETAAVNGVCHDLLRFFMRYENNDLIIEHSVDDITYTSVTISDEAKSNVFAGIESGSPADIDAIATDDTTSKYVRITLKHASSTISYIDILAIYLSTPTGVKCKVETSDDNVTYTLNTDYSDTALAPNPGVMFIKLSQTLYLQSTVKYVRITLWRETIPTTTNKYLKIFHIEGRGYYSLSNPNYPFIWDGNRTLKCASDISENGTLLSAKYLGINATAVTANAWKTARTFTMTGDVVGSVTFDGSKNLSYATTIMRVPSEKVIHDITANTSGTVSAVDASLIDVTGACRTAMLPAANITVEYSNDGGTTWLADPVFDTDSAKEGLFTMNRASTVFIGSNTVNNPGDTSTNMLSRVTIIPDGRYVKVNKFYCWASTNGHVIVVDIEYSTKGDPTIFTALRSDVHLGGWPNNNVINFSPTLFGGSSSQLNFPYAYRFTFKYESTVEEYATTRSTIQDIRMYGSVCYNYNNDLMFHGVPYAYIGRNQTIFRDGPVRFSDKSLNQSGAIYAELGLTTTTVTVPYMLLQRGGSIAASWRLINDGNFSLQCNYTTAIGDWYNVMHCKNNTGDVTFKGNVAALSFVGNASSASKWQTPRTLTLTGPITGTASIDGTANVSLATELSPIATLEYTSTSAAYMSVGKATDGSKPCHAKLRITATGVGIDSRFEVELFYNVGGTPLGYFKNAHASTSTAYTGLYYGRMIYPKSPDTGATYPLYLDLQAYNATSRNIKVELLEADNFELLETAIDSVYASANYSFSTLPLYSSGIGCNQNFRGSFTGHATTSSYINMPTDAIKLIAASDILGETIVSVGTDGKAYSIIDTAATFDMNNFSIIRSNAKFAAGDFVSGYYSYMCSLSRAVGTNTGADKGKPVWLKITRTGTTWKSLRTISFEDPSTEGTWIRLGYCFSSTSMILCYDHPIVEINSVGDNRQTNATDKLLVKSLTAQASWTIDSDKTGYSYFTVDTGRCNCTVYDTDGEEVGFEVIYNVVNNETRLYIPTSLTTGTITTNWKVYYKRID